MRTEKDIQLELLQDITDVCIQNNLKYILIGSSGLNAFLNHTIKNGPFSVAIAMTPGDIGRFSDVIERDYQETRYVEKINGESEKWYINYGNRNTTNFYIFNAYNKKHNGININIYPIRGLDKKPVKEVAPKKENKGLFSKILNKISKSNDDKPVKEEPKDMDDTFVDKWEDIQKFSTIKIINSKISTTILTDVMGYEVDNVELFLPKESDKFFKRIFGKNYKNREIKSATFGPRYIINTEVGYEQIIEENKDLIDEAISLNDEIKVESAKVDGDRQSVKDLWELVLMTNKEIEYTRLFDEKLDHLLSFDLSDKNQLNEVYKELKPVILSLKKYAKQGMAFSINPQADELIEKVLIAKSDDKLVNEINELKKKQYYVE